MTIRLPQDICLLLAETEQQILVATASRQTVIQEAARDLASSGGKRLRPLFVLLGGAFGKRRDPDLPKLAAAIELLHMATLVHDDIIDDAAVRRGSPTIQSKFGKDVAVFTGDFLLTRSLFLLTQAASKNLMADLTRMMTHICEGEVSQYSGRFEVPSVLSYLRRIRAKTAEVFALGMAAGSKQCGADELTRKRLLRYARAFGMAFQIEDDILDFSANSRDLGKPVGRDVLSGVYTLPVLYALRDKEVGDTLRSLLAREKGAHRNRREFHVGESKACTEDAKKITSLILKTSAMKEVQAVRNLYVDRALKAVAPLPGIPARNALIDLVRSAFATGRID